MENPTPVSAAATLRNPGSTPNNRNEPGPTFAHIENDYHGPKNPKTRASTGDIVGKVVKPAAKKSSPKKKGAGKAK